MLHDEILVPFSEAVELLPRLRKGKRPHPSTLWRWHKRGVHGVFLEAVRFGHAYCTSREALERFATALAEIDESVQGTSGPCRERHRRRSDRQRTDAFERAQRHLREAGILPEEP